MEKTIVCPVGDQPEAIYPALREFTVKHVHLLTHPKFSAEREQMITDLEKFGIKHSEARMKQPSWEDVFTKIAEFIRHFPHPEHIVVHVGTGDREMQCAATSASFVNGVRAVNGDKDILFGLPVMKFSYYTVLQDRKLKVMEAIAKGERSLNDIGNELSISLSLLSYHVHGNRKSEGLIEMGLVELEERGNQSFISLTPMGRLILKGYIPELEIPA